MTKTQIQVPEELLDKVRRLARQKEWSLAETFRRGAELLVDRYVLEGRPSGAEWTPPSSASAGWKGLTAAQLKTVAFEEASTRTKP